jgi:hypothetical protein
VCPGSRTKVSIPLVLPPTRHPERSASPVYRVTQRLWRGVEGPRRCLFYPCRSELFSHLARTVRARYGFSLGPRTKMIECVSQQIILSGFSGRKAPNSTGKISTAEVLRLRATSAVSRDKPVRRSAQDDESVGEPEEKQQVPPLRFAPVPRHAGTGGMTSSSKGR